MRNEIFVNDVGTTFTITVTGNGGVLDISEAIVKDIIFKNSATDYKFKRTGTFVTDGSDGKLKYSTINGDLKSSGTYEIQVYIELPSGKWHSTISNFNVFEIL